MYVLGVYGLLFGIMLPAIVGNWWYKSIQYTSEAVLIKTTKLFEFYVYRTPFDQGYSMKVRLFFRLSSLKTFGIF